MIICMKIDLALNNLQRLICHKTQTTKPNYSHYNKNLIIIVALLNQITIKIHFYYSGLMTREIHNHRELITIDSHRNY